MGILDNFEKRLERALNGAFAKTFRSGLQPVELTSGLRRELDTKAAIVSRDRILAPNRFTLHMSPTDHERMSQMGATLVDELVSYVTQYAAEQGYQFAGAVSVSMIADESLTEGLLQVDSSNVKGDVTWVPTLEIGSKRYPLHTGNTVIGRGHEADITIEDTGISRRHVQITWDGERAQAQDLGSTNGSKLNGEPLRKAILAPDSVISIGRTSIVFRVLPQAQSARPDANHANPANPATTASPAQPAHPVAPADRPADDFSSHNDIGGFWSTP